MATRANIVIYDEKTDETVYLYHHWDGYIAGVGAELLRIVFERGRHFTSCEAIAKILLECGGYEETTGIHGDIEFLYIITIKDNGRIAVTAREREWNKGSRDVEYYNWGKPVPDYGCDVSYAYMEEYQDDNGTKTLSDYTDDELIAELSSRLKK